MKRWTPETICLLVLCSTVPFGVMVIPINRVFAGAALSETAGVVIGLVTGTLGVTLGKEVAQIIREHIKANSESKNDTP